MLLEFTGSQHSGRKAVAVSLPIPLSIADLASVAHGESIREGLDASVMLASAQLAAPTCWRP
jgi:hypothetical protein